MMFTELLPLLAERDLVITLAGKPEGKVLAYVQPKPKTGEPEAEAGAFLSPFVVTATAQELDTQLPAALAQWVAVRQGECASVRAALDAAKAQVKASAEAARAAAAQRAKGKTVPPARLGKPTPPVASTATITPSAMDDEEEDCIGEPGGEPEGSAGEPAAPASTPKPAGASAAMLTTTDSLFGD